MKQDFFHELYRHERSGEIAAACNITEYSISIVFYDLALRRRYARSVSYGTEVTAASAAERFGTLFAAAVMEYGIGDAVKKVGIAARFSVGACIEEAINCEKLGIPQNSEIWFVPFISAGIGGGFTASLLTIGDEDFAAAELGKTLYLAKKNGSELLCAAFPMSGALDGSGLESGMPAEKGAIDAVRRDKDGTVAYEVIGDGESAGISPCAAIMAAVIMRRLGALDDDGIITDRDLFYIGEDYFVSQSDVRAIQADKAGLAAAFEVFLKEIGEDPEAPIYLSGEIFSDARGLKALSELGAIPEGALRAAFCRNSAEQGLILFLEDEKTREKARQIAESAVDITDRLLEAYDERYFENLSF